MAIDPMKKQIIRMRERASRSLRADDQEKCAAYEGRYKRRDRAMHRKEPGRDQRKQRGGNEPIEDGALDVHKVPCNAHSIAQALAVVSLSDLIRPDIEWLSPPSFSLP